VENLKEKEYLEKLGLNGRIILKSILIKVFLSTYRKHHQVPLLVVQQGTVPHSDNEVSKCLSDCRGHLKRPVVVIQTYGEHTIFSLCAVKFDICDQLQRNTKFINAKQKG
jgi:hypothetical protein